MDAAEKKAAKKALKQELRSLEGDDSVKGKTKGQCMWEETYESTALTENDCNFGGQVVIDPCVGLEVYS